MSNDKLSYSQSKLLDTLSKSGAYFLPFCIDCKWDNADSIKVIDINELIIPLSRNSAWWYEDSTCYLEYKVHMLELHFKDMTIRDNILKEFKLCDYMNMEICDDSYITIFLRQNDLKYDDFVITIMKRLFKLYSKK